MKAIIEIPKGDDGRRHIKPDKSGFIDLGPIKEVIPINGGIMPIHYGHIPETLNEKEGDEIDETKKLVKGWNDIPENERKLIENFFSYHHKFLSVKDSEVAGQYIKHGYEQFLCDRQ